MFGALIHQWMKLSSQCDVTALRGTVAYLKTKVAQLGAKEKYLNDFFPHFTKFESCKHKKYKNSRRFLRVVNPPLSKNRHLTKGIDDSHFSWGNLLARELARINKRLDKTKPFKIYLIGWNLISKAFSLARTFYQDSCKSDTNCFSLHNKIQKPQQYVTLKINSDT